MAKSRIPMSAPIALLRSYRCCLCAVSAKGSYLIPFIPAGESIQLPSHLASQSLYPKVVFLLFNRDS